VGKIWRQRLERADFAADRARRQYQLTKPENRLVARQLEKEWEAALAERQRLGEEYDRFTASRSRALTPPSATRSAPWPPTSPPSGMRRRPPALIASS
jgi:hypothetical protein